jgi:hypothetical protein
MDEAVTGSSYLTLDVDLFERGLARGLEDVSHPAGEETHPIALFLEERLAAMIAKKKGGFLVGLEAEFLGDEAKSYVRLVSIRRPSAGRTGRGA